jgi:hypothetical protein
MTAVPAPSSFNGMTLFWRQEEPNADYLIEYKVYRPDGQTGPVYPIVCSDPSLFQGDYVIFQFTSLRGDHHLGDRAWIWDDPSDVIGGRVELTDLPFYFAFYSMPDWSQRTVVGYVPGIVMPNEPPHGSLLHVYPPIPGRYSTVRSDFGVCVPTVGAIYNGASWEPKFAPGAHAQIQGDGLLTIA